ncbi:hypothetical protein EFT57_00815 [Lacticaseibacillus paracasei]|nr:hypothetical protein [Lacticaseibacillus paracasei]RDV42916.1 hypothetical protein DQM07_00940 [Lacticaseibacillus paracasei subsp. paracasei]
MINENIEQSSTALKQANNAIYSGNVGLLLMGNYYSESDKAHVLEENDDLYYLFNSPVVFCIIIIVTISKRIFL